MNFTSAEKWMHDLYTLVDNEKWNKLRQWNDFLIETYDN